MPVCRPAPTPSEGAIATGISRSIGSELLEASAHDGLLGPSHRAMPMSMGRCTSDAQLSAGQKNQRQIHNTFSSHFGLISSFDPYSIYRIELAKWTV